MHPILGCSAIPSSLSLSLSSPSLSSPSLLPRTGLLEGGFLKPPFVPSRNEVHAESTLDIGHGDDKKWRDTKLSADFEKQVNACAQREEEEEANLTHLKKRVICLFRQICMH